MWLTDGEMSRATFIMRIAHVEDVKIEAKTSE